MSRAGDSIISDSVAARRLADALHSDPFAVLGPHHQRLWSYQPDALGVDVLDADTDELVQSLVEFEVPGLFVSQKPPPSAYRLRVHRLGGSLEIEDPYRFGVMLPEQALQEFAQGQQTCLGQFLGAHLISREGVAGVGFAVWAPQAQRVSVVGDFNDWDGRCHPMRFRSTGGVWELFVPGLMPGERYKYELVSAQGDLALRADPCAQAGELPPGNASRVAAPLDHQWQDWAWLARRGGSQAPLSIYELHAGSWQKSGQEYYGWRELADHLVPYVKELGFTHIELLPVMEHPFAGSWGYQVLSQYAVSARHGGAEDFAYFVDVCHQANVGVILDWVPGHFPDDDHGLRQFDGSALYEYAHPYEGRHRDWGTCVFNFAKPEVRSYLVSAALHWLRDFHIDGLRVDAVAAMLYRDYSRSPGEWIPNRDGGRENIEAIDFLQQLTAAVATESPQALLIAEESSDFPGVSHGLAQDGLGFSHKWNMGWMNDTLHYIQTPPKHRADCHRQLGFGLMYAFNEHYVLPISHDEVVYGKGSLLQKMPGDHWQKFANVRLYLSFMWTHPGKKLLFMGCEFAACREWNHDDELEWELLQIAEHQGVMTLVKELNRLYCHHGALHELDDEPAGFQWLVADDSRNSVFAWLRRDAGGRPLLVIHNFTPRRHHNYQLGAPLGGEWEVLFNSDEQRYGGSDTIPVPKPSAERWHGQPQSLSLSLPPLASLILAPKNNVSALSQ